MVTKKENTNSQSTLSAPSPASEATALPTDSNPGAFTEEEDFTTPPSSISPGTLTEEIVSTPPSINTPGMLTEENVSTPGEATPASSVAMGSNPFSSERSALRSDSDSVWSASTISASSSAIKTLQMERDQLLRTIEGERARAAAMQRLVEEERLLSQRLRAEGGTGDVSAAEARLRILQLQRDIQAAGAKAARRSTNGMFASACSTDLLFLIDTTGSMWDYIQAAKEQVRSIVKDIRESFLNEAELRISVVSYKDHKDKPNIEFLDFTNDVDQVHAFLDKLSATGGNDAPEDVLGGIQQALNATWTQQTRCVIHIADAPPHGHNLQNHPDPGDDYPFPGMEPHGLHHENILEQMISLKLNYAFLRITQNTDKMVYEFLKAYDDAGADCRMLKDNKNDFELALRRQRHRNDSSMSSSKQSAKAGLVFDEFEIGTTYSALRHLVVKMVTTSASRTAVRMSGGRRSKLGSDKRKQDGKLGAINEDAVIEEEDEDGNEDKDDDLKKPSAPMLEKTPPNWDIEGWLDEKLSVEGFSPDIMVHNANTLDSMMENDDNIMMGITELNILKRSRPFAEGALRMAHFARTAASTNKFVVKTFKRGGKRLPHLAEDMRAQALCKAFALEFNALGGAENSLDFIVTTCLKGKGTLFGDDCMSLEPYLDGEYVKYNNNCGYVNEEDNSNLACRAAQAFSHFTFERSRGRFLVCDLQGVGNLLTDPAIHTDDHDRFPLSDTNLGIEGFKFFFSSHTCNDVCRKLGLKSSLEMFSTRKFEFRTSWPGMDNTLCCSNKLCGKIILRSNARKTDKLPGYRWCGSCWTHLQPSLHKERCIVQGPLHEFYSSKFFCESQGRLAIRKCPVHRQDELPTPKPSSALDAFWSRLKSANKRRSLFRRKD